MTIRGLLFDLDGTLTKPGALDFPAIKKTLGCPIDRPILEFLDEQPPSNRVKLMGVLDEIEEKAAELSVPNVGAKECLYFFREKGYVLGIITRNSEKAVMTTLRRFEGIDISFFKAVITRDSSLPKPHPGGVVKAAGQMGLMTEHLMVVGDFRFDVMAGKEAGAKTVLVTNGGPPVMQKGDPEPDFVIKRLAEIKDLPADWR